MDRYLLKLKTEVDWFGDQTCLDSEQSCSGLHQITETLLRVNLHFCSRAQILLIQSSSKVLRENKILMRMTNSWHRRWWESPPQGPQRPFPIIQGFPSTHLPAKSGVIFLFIMTVFVISSAANRPKQAVTPTPSEPENWHSELLLEWMAPPDGQRWKNKTWQKTQSEQECIHWFTYR